MSTEGSGCPGPELLRETASQVLLPTYCCLVWDWPESRGLAPERKNVFSPKCLCLVITLNSEATRSITTVRFVW